MKGPNDRKRAAGLGLALALFVLGSPSASRAQSAAPSATDEGPAQTPTASAPAPARRDSDPPADELSERVSSGPTLGERERAARRGHPLDRPNYASDPADPDLPVAVTLALGGGATIAGSGFDQVLRSHDYSSSGAFYLGDLTVLGRLNDWLFIGGRFGGRARTFVRNDGPGGTAGAMDLQAIVMARLQLGRVIDLGVHVGGGGAVVGIVLHDGASNGIAPRVTAGIHIGFRVGHGIRLVVRGSYDYCRWLQMDRYGDDLELGGLSGALGLEVRS